MAAFSLFELYHPGGLPRHETEQHQHGVTCGCGCGLRKNCTAEDLGFKDTAAMVEIARLKKLERERAVKPPAPGNPWKGAKRSVGTVELPDVAGGECIDPECEHEHATLYDEHSKEHRYHLVCHPANVFTLPNGAEARVRADKKFKV